MSVRPLVVLSALALCAASLQASVFTVTNTNDSGAGSLRQAILDANANPGADQIAFAIGSGPQSISIATALPVATGPVTIDATTQPGFASAPIVEVHGPALADNVSGFVGLDLAGGNSTVRGLVVNRFAKAIRIDGGHNVIAGNYIGLSAGGTAASTRPYSPSLYPNHTQELGVVIAAGDQGSRVGGVTTADRNVIAGWDQAIVTGTGSCTVQGNFIGINAMGTALAGSYRGRFGIAGTAGPSQVGGSQAGARNVVAGFDTAIAVAAGATVENNYVGTDRSGSLMLGGIDVGIAASGNARVLSNVVAGADSDGIAVGDVGATVQGNFVGTDASGTHALPNHYGIHVLGNSGSIAIGGSGAGQGNVISGNTSDGIITEPAGTSNIYGNLIGTAANGVSALGNGGFGVRSGSGQRVGGVVPGEGNTIRFNHSGGIFEGPSTQSTGNSIYDNGGPAISGSSQPPPVITQAVYSTGVLWVKGTVSVPHLSAVDIYLNPSCPAAAGTEARKYLGRANISNDISGWDFDATFLGVASGSIVATAADWTSDAGTSVLSACVSIGARGVVQFSSAQYSVSENAGHAVLTLVRTGGTRGTFPVYLFPQDGTAHAPADYDKSPKQVTFADGQSSLSVQIPIVDDSAGQPNLTFTVQLGGADSAYEVGPLQSATVTILDDDVRGVSADDVSVAEGNAGQKTVPVGFTLSNASPTPVAVHWHTRPGSALDGVDFIGASGVLTFAPGDVHGTIALRIIGNTKPEPEKVFSVVLDSVDGGEVIKRQAVVRITNDDPYYTSRYDQEYGRIGEDALLLDLFLPAGTSAPAPLIIYIHGDDWWSGSKDVNYALREAERGYAVASINYRLSSKSWFPAQINDCRRAVRWLRAHAGELNIDPQRIAAWGTGGGAHLAALLGTAAEVEAFDDATDPNLAQSPKVAAVVNAFGASDLVKLAASVCNGQPRDPFLSPEANLLGCPVIACTDRARQASPITYVSAGDAPFLSFYAVRDCDIPYEQGQVLHDALTAAGVKSTLVPLGDEVGTMPVWNIASVAVAVDAFLDSALKPVVVRHRPAGH